MTYIEKQIIMLNARILLDHAEITSGAYKFHETHHLDGTQLTEQEKLKNAMGTMRAHVNWLYNATEYKEEN